MISFRTTIHLNLSLETRYRRRIVLEKSKLSVTSWSKTYSIEASFEICIRESLKRSYKIHQNPLFRSSYFFIRVLHVTSCSSKFFQAFTYKQNSIYAHTHTELISLSCMLERRKQLGRSRVYGRLGNRSELSVWSSGIVQVFLQYLVSVSVANGANTAQNFANGHPYLRGINVLFYLPYISNIFTSSPAGTPVQEQAAPSVKPLSM